MEPSVIEEVRLTAFKSFKDAALPLDELTLLVGRNGSGKSNALDGLWTLTRLAQGDDVRDALDGGRDGPAVRGGAAGCAPFGQSAFALGCTVRTGTEQVHLDVTVQVEPVVQVVAERLWSGEGELLVSEPPRADSGDIEARWGIGSAGARPLSFRATRLLATQVLARVPATTAGQRVHLAAAQVLAALRSVFVLDPVPHLMRRYVPRRDVLLRRGADNLSAAVASLLEDPARAERLSAALSRLNEQEVVDVTTSRSELDDVMLTLIERFAGSDRPVPARVMSDGSLRFLAILVALMQAPTVDTVPEPLASEDALGQTTLVIEELENGLHASQAQLLIGLVREEVHHRRVRALATAHSPALLDALTGEEHRSVVVCQRDRDGRSTLRRLVDLPNYVDIVAAGTLGRAAERDRLRETATPTRAPSEVLAEILGGSPS
ncbi:MAG: AAA family ATPase [Actinobacteria bacterium]|nr:AAA family ATPase [Actinomycetota bacterium]